MTALALRDDQTAWDKQQLAVLHQTGIDEDVTEAELAAFLHECQRRKLDPFTRQIYLIGRQDKRKGRKVYRSQTSIDGFRLIARRAADNAGIDYSYEDTIWYDADGGRHEIWLSPQPPAGAKVVVIRNGCRFDAVARFGAYVQTDYNGNPSGQWRSMADVMIAKCAEALALRKAFPEDLGGIYTEEEMAQADNPQRVHATAEVVRDERLQPGASAAAAAAAATDEDWFGAAQGRVGKVATKGEWRGLWAESVSMVNAGKCTRADAERIQDMLRARADELGLNKPAAPPLDENDEWLIRIRDVATADEAETVLSELVEEIKGERITEPRAGQLRDALAGRAQEVADVIAGKVAA